MAKERRFATRLEHYRLQKNQPDDPEMVQFVGRELYGKIRRQIADVSSAALTNLTALPVSETDDDRYTAQDAKWAAEMDLQDTSKGFEIYLERAALGAAVAREWWIRLDWDADVGEFGEVLFGNEQPQKVMLCPPFQDVWDKRLPYLIHEQDVDLEAARAKFGDDLMPDNLGNSDPSVSMIVNEQGMVSYGTMPEPGSGMIPSRKTLLYCWSQFDYSKREVKNERRLSDQKRYMMCQQCGSMTPPSAGLPPVSMEPCPMCEADGMPSPMVRIDSEVLTTEEREFQRGKRLEIVDALTGRVLNPKPDQQQWPAPKGGFPFCKLVRYEDMTDTSGVSDTKLDAPLQVISNVLMQKLYETTFMAPNILFSLSPLKDKEGNDFTVSNAPWQIAFPEDPTLGAKMEHFKADPINASVVNLWQQVQGAFRADMGTPDLGRAAQDPKGVPVGTVERIVESGDIPTDHWIKRIRYVLSPFVATLSAYQQRFWTKARWIRYKGTLGEQAFKRLAGADIPNADFRFPSDRTHDVLEFKKAQTILQWLQIPNPVWRDMLAPKFGIEPEFVDAIKQAEQEQAQGQEMNIVAEVVARMGIDPNQFMPAYMQLKQQMMGAPGMPGVSGGPAGAAGPAMPIPAPQG